MKLEKVLCILVGLVIVSLACERQAVSQTYHKGDKVEVKITDEKGTEKWYPGTVEKIITWKDEDGKSGAFYTVTVPIEITITDADVKTILRKPVK